MANKTKDPSVQVQFAGKLRTLRWDYNTIAELQDFGVDFTDPEAVKGYEAALASGKRPLKLMRAMACAALNSGAEDGDAFTPVQLGRLLSAEPSDLMAKVIEVMSLAAGDDGPSPLAETPTTASE